MLAQQLAQMDGILDTMASIEAASEHNADGALRIDEEAQRLGDLAEALEAMIGARSDGKRSRRIGWISPQLEGETA